MSSGKTGWLYKCNEKFLQTVNTHEGIAKYRIKYPTDTRDLIYKYIDNYPKNSTTPSTWVSNTACFPARLCRYSRSERLSMKKFSVRTTGQRE